MFYHFVILFFGCCTVVSYKVLSSYLSLAYEFTFFYYYVFSFNFIASFRKTEKTEKQKITLISTAKNTRQKPTRNE